MLNADTTLKELITLAGGKSVGTLTEKLNALLFVLEQSNAPAIEKLFKKLSKKVGYEAINEYDKTMSAYYVHCTSVSFVVGMLFQRDPLEALRLVEKLRSMGDD